MSDESLPCQTPPTPDNGALPLPPDEDIRRFLAGLQQRMLPVLKKIHDWRTEATEAVRAEHPHYFITYPEPRTPQEKLKMRNRRSKIESRNDDRERAIAAKLAELGGNPFNAAYHQRVVLEQTVVFGWATPQQEIDYLEARYNSEADLEGLE